MPERPGIFWCTQVWRSHEASSSSIFFRKNKGVHLFKINVLGILFDRKLEQIRQDNWAQDPSKVQRRGRCVTQWRFKNDTGASSWVCARLCEVSRNDTPKTRSGMSGNRFDCDLSGGRLDGPTRSATLRRKSPFVSAKVDDWRSLTHGTNGRKSYWHQLNLHRGDIFKLACLLDLMAAWYKFVSKSIFYVNWSDFCCFFLQTPSESNRRHVAIQIRSTNRESNICTVVAGRESKELGEKTCPIQSTYGIFSYIWLYIYGKCR